MMMMLNDCNSSIQGSTTSSSTSDVMTLTTASSWCAIPTSSRIRVLRLIRPHARRMLVAPDCSPSYGFAVRGGKEFGTGFFVSNVERNSEAELKGLRTGDQILRINGFRLDDAIHKEFIQLVTSQDRVTLKVRGVGMLPTKDQDDDRLSWNVVKMPSISNTPSESSYKLSAATVERRNNSNNSNHSNNNNGMLVVEHRSKDINVVLNVAPRTKLGLGICKGPEWKPGIFVQFTKEKSVAREAGLRPGDQILSVNSIDFSDVLFSEAVAVMKSSNKLDMIVRTAAGCDLFPGESSGYNSSASSVTGDQSPCWADVKSKRLTAVREEPTTSTAAAAAAAATTAATAATTATASTLSTTIPKHTVDWNDAKQVYMEQRRKHTQTDLKKQQITNGNKELNKTIIKLSENGTSINNTYIANSNKISMHKTAKLAKTLTTATAAAADDCLTFVPPPPPPLADNWTTTAAAAATGIGTGMIETNECRKTVIVDVHRNCATLKKQKQLQLQQQQQHQQHQHQAACSLQRNVGGFQINKNDLYMQQATQQQQQQQQQRSATTTTTTRTQTTPAAHKNINIAGGGGGAAAGNVAACGSSLSSAINEELKKRKEKQQHQQQKQRYNRDTEQQQQHCNYSNNNNSNTVQRQMSKRVTMLTTTTATAPTTTTTTTPTSAYTLTSVRATNVAAAVGAVSNCNGERNNNNNNNNIGGGVGASDQHSALMDEFKRAHQRMFKNRLHDESEHKKEREETLKRTSFMADDTSHRNSRQLDVNIGAANKPLLNGNNNNSNALNGHVQDVQNIPPPPPQFANSLKQQQQHQSNGLKSNKQYEVGSNTTPMKPPTSPVPDYDQVQLRSAGGGGGVGTPYRVTKENNTNSVMRQSTNNNGRTMRLGTVTIGEYSNNVEQYNNGNNNNNNNNNNNIVIRKEPGKFDFVNSVTTQKRNTLQNNNSVGNTGSSSGGGVENLHSELQNTLSRSNLRMLSPNNNGVNGNEAHLEHQSHCQLQQQQQQQQTFDNTDVDGINNSSGVANENGVESIMRKLQGNSINITNMNNGTPTTVVRNSSSSNGSGSNGILKNGNRNSNGSNYSKNTEKSITFGN